MNKKIIWGGVGILFLGLILLSSVILNKSDFDKNVDKLQIVTTLFPVYDFAKIIGGERTDVTLLLPPGVEPHGFEPKPSDIVKINNSDLFVYTGKHMETWVDDIIRGITSANINIVDSSVGVELIQDLDHDHDHGHEPEADHHEENVQESHDDDHHHGGVDPHFWLDFDNAQLMVDTIASAMKIKDPTNADYYSNNADNLKAGLMGMDREYRETISRCQSKKIIYGGHYAFGYMAQRYGLEYVAAQGFSPNSEPTANDLISLVQQIKKDNIGYIFYEELSNPKVAETLSRETGARMLLLNGAHNLSKDAFENNTSYLSIMKDNLENLSLGLGCDV